MVCSDERMMILVRRDGGVVRDGDSRLMLYEVSDA
jgi:hypothetical protein